MPFRQCLNFGEGLNGNLAAVFADAAQQGLSRPAEGAAPPTGVLFARVSLLPLQNPLERIINDAPGLVKLGYEAIRRVRWTFNAVLVVLMGRRCRRPLAHLCVGRSLFAGGCRASVGAGPSSFGFACLLGRKCVLARTRGEQITRTFCGQAPLIRIRRRSQPIEGNGAPDRIRTCDLCLRRATLYPTELRVLVARP